MLSHQYELLEYGRVRHSAFSWSLGLRTHCGLGALQSTHLLLSFVFWISSNFAISSVQRPLQIVFQSLHYKSPLASPAT
jgi:hypothetical protein